MCSLNIYTPVLEFGFLKSKKKWTEPSLQQSLPTPKNESNPILFIYHYI